MTDDGRQVMAKAHIYSYKDRPVMSHPQQDQIDH